MQASSQLVCGGTRPLMVQLIGGNVLVKNWRTEQLTALGAGWQVERKTSGNYESNEKDALSHPKWWRQLLLCMLLFSDLPCMHLDPGVNRLGLNITSVHQTDRRPVTPDIVFPICVILWPQEDGLKKTQQKKKRGQYIWQIRSRVHACIRDQRSLC